MSFIALKNQVIYTKLTRMSPIPNHETTLHLINYYYESKVYAQTTSHDYYQHLLHEPESLKTRLDELVRLNKLHHSEATALDRQIYLSHGDDPHFLVTYFSSPDCPFSTTELEKYRQALVIHQKQQTLHYLMARVIFRLASENKGIQNPLVYPELEQLSSIMEILQAVKINSTETSDTCKCVPAPGRKKSCTFGYLETEELLGSIVDELTAEIGFLRPPTTTADFLKVATTHDPASVGIAVYFGCLNTQLIYVIEYFKALFLSFNAATIGNSRLFFSKNRNLLNGHNLNSTSSDHIHQRYAIDAIFKKYNIPKP